MKRLEIMAYTKTIQIDKSKLVIHLTDNARSKWGLEACEKMMQDSLKVLSNFLFSKNTCLDKKIHQEIEVDLHFCGDKRMRQINSEHRNKDKTTDVLSFPMYESLRPDSTDFVLPGPVMLGDIIISRNVARKQAREFNLSLEQEVIHLFCHGLLHLLGYDHEISEKEEEIMESLEKEILLKIKKARN
ncbi:MULTISPECIES: rRNA maturation RNase YbeY [unclassified Halobacteriovorax]|uniref:rRNA maturation RNase YbeY n=2 Tax=unclassified Halobacteriovorax TaxID=2639665 RepID=UPI000EA29F57|nr:rRNA maturation RNase YbeY [Halobacteriovorax sp. BALOs_7]